MSTSRSLPDHESRAAKRFAVDRPAYTMIELAIVLAILTAFAMLTWPVLMKPWQRSEAQLAAETIREALIDTRITAMTEGHVYEFRWKANTNEYEAVSRDPIPTEPQLNRSQPSAPGQANHDTAPSADETNQMPTRTEALDLLVRQSDNQQMQKVKIVQARLPADTIFFDARAIESAFFHDDFDMTGERKRFTPTTNGKQGDEVRQRRDRMQSWHSVNFYPDGRADNQTLTIRSVNDYEVEIVVRGLTGGIAISNPRRVQRQAINLENMEQIDMDNLTNEIAPDQKDDDSQQ